ncbi:MAG TPA: DUF2968 domain-containing protein [Trinickia sp.]|nr:DUF2968 domain-containing protein [Trinickia sp.]
MRKLSRMRGAALAALVLIGGIGMVGGARAQSVADGASAAAAASAVLAPALVASAPVVAAASTDAASLPAPSAPEQSASATDAAPAADAASATAADDTQESQGNVGELHRLMRSNDVTELRTTYNGSYGASLLLYGKELTYYIVLFQQKNFWRVIKTQDDVRAEAIYAEFVHKSAQLADVEVRRAKLAAQKAYTERLIALSQARADRLQADLDVARQQQALVSSRQKQARDEAAALDAQKRAEQDQLRHLRRQVRALQREADQGLPRSVH